MNSESSLPNLPAIFDSHCHYNLEPLESDWQHHWQTAQAHGVTQAVIVGTSLATSYTAVEMAGSDPNLFAAIGLHPNDIQDYSQAQITAEVAELEKLVTTSPHREKIVAIGETGLDYFHLSPDTRRQQQQSQRYAFIAQLRLAHDLDLPIIIHVRDQEVIETPTEHNAYWDMLQQLKKVALPEHSPFILHCVSGPLSYLHQALELGAYVGVAANVTYPSAHHIRQLVQNVPADRLLLETDAPFLPPQAHRGETCEPWMISQTAEYLHTELGIDLERCRENTKKVFKVS